MIKGQILKAMRETPGHLVEGILDVVAAPPKRAVAIWEGLSEEDKALFKQAAISGAKIAARMIIAADTGVKKEF